jgi:hypothetical protein
MFLPIGDAGQWKYVTRCKYPKSNRTRGQRFKPTLPCPRKTDRPVASSCLESASFTSPLIYPVVQVLPCSPPAPRVLSVRMSDNSWSKWSMSLGKSLSECPWSMSRISLIWLRKYMPPIRDNLSVIYYWVRHTEGPCSQSACICWAQPRLGEHKASKFEMRNIWNANATTYKTPRCATIG